MWPELKSNSLSLLVRSTKIPMVQIWIIFFHHSSYVLELLKKLVLDYLAFEWLCQKIQSNSPIKIPNKMWFSVPSFSLPCFQIRGDQVTSKNPQSPGAKLSRKRKDLIKRLDSVINNGTSNITINYFRYVCCCFFSIKMWNCCMSTACTMRVQHVRRCESGLQKICK